MLSNKTYFTNYPKDNYFNENNYYIKCSVLEKKIYTSKKSNIIKILQKISNEMIEKNFSFNQKFRLLDYEFKEIYTKNKKTIHCYKTNRNYNIWKPFEYFEGCTIEKSYKRFDEIWGLREYHDNGILYIMKTRCYKGIEKTIEFVSLSRWVVIPFDILSENEKSENNKKNELMINILNNNYKIPVKIGNNIFAQIEFQYYNQYKLNICNSDVLSKIIYIFNGEYEETVYLHHKIDTSAYNSWIYEQNLYIN